MTMTYEVRAYKTQKDYDEYHAGTIIEGITRKRDALREAKKWLSDHEVVKVQSYDCEFIEVLKGQKRKHRKEREAAELQRMILRDLQKITCEPPRYRVDVRGVGETRWSSNALEFDSEAEATQYAIALLDRWYGADGFRVVPVDTPRREAIDPAQVRQF